MLEASACRRRAHGGRSQERERKLRTAAAIEDAISGFDAKAQRNVVLVALD